MIVFMDKKVTVIMPCYNQAAYARESIESVLNQTYKNLELLLIDNFSTDGTCEIIKEYAKKDSRVHAIYHEKNMGFEYSFNEGMEKATGEFISFTSSDDYWYPKKIEKQLDVLEKNPEYDVVHTDAQIIDGQGKKCKMTMREYYYLEPKKATGDIFRTLSKKNICCCSSMFFRRKCLETYSKFDPVFKIVHDWWFNIKLSQKHKFFYIPGVLVDYRIHSTNTSKNKEALMNDYIEIHSRLAKMTHEQQSHYMAIATSAARIGKNYMAREAIKKAENAGRMSMQNKLIAFIITKFDNCGKMLEMMNEPKHWFLGIRYKVLKV